MLGTFINWLGGTSLSLEFKTLGWLVPLSQSIHILAVAVVFSAFLMLTMRATGVTAQGVGINLLNARFLPWVWTSILVLFVTGVLQIIAEPGRAMPNLWFQLKMLFLLVVMAMLVAFQRSVRRHPREWHEERVFPFKVRGMFGVIVAMTVFIIFCGRWIAYSGR